MSRHAGNRLSACLVVAALAVVGCDDVLASDDHYIVLASAEFTVE